MEALSSLFTLRWTNSPKYHPLPEDVTRQFITTPSRPNDKLELLVTNATSVDKSSRPPPVLFVHGGFGSASVWLPFMSHLSTTTQCFALSTRNHGASYSVPYLRMVFGTTVPELASDIVAAIAHVRATTGRAPVLVAHSSGGGLAQYLLAHGLATASALVLLDAVPHFGGFGVHANWAKHDPWFVLRILLHGYHPASPLSSTRLIRGAFFGPGHDGAVAALSDGEVEEFARWMSNYESLMWPMQMFGSFWGWLTGRPRWLDVKDVLKRITGVNEKVCVIVGDKDVLMDVPMCRKAAEEYRVGIEQLEKEKKMESSARTDAVVGQHDGTTTQSAGRVRFVVVKDAGHHSQNDVQWEHAAEALKRFVEQV